MTELLEQAVRIASAMIECHFGSLAALRGGREAAGIRRWANSLGCSHSLDLSGARAAEDPEAVWGALLDTGCGAIQTGRAEATIAWLGTRHRSAAR